MTHPKGADTEQMWLLASLEKHSIGMEQMARTVLAHVEACPGCPLCGEPDHLARARLIELGRQILDLPPRENR